MRLLFIDLSTKLDTIYDLEKRGRGGMVTSLFKVSDYLSAKGHDVTVLSDVKHDGVTKHGTKWLHEAFGEYDCLVTNRGTGDGYPQIQARARVLWTHDLPHSGFIPEPKTIRGFKCTVFMSRYAEQVWRAFYKDIGKSVLIPNGVDRKLFFDRGKRKDYLLYMSAPNRGLDKLPLIHDAVQTRLDRPITLKAYSNLASLHPGEGEDRFDYKAIEDSGVILKAPVSQQKIAYELGRAEALLMPSGYPEICSNSVLQALASGTPVIGTGNLGFINEWVKHRKNGLLTKYGPWNYMIHTVEMVRNIVNYMTGDQTKLQRKAQKTRVWTWQQVGRAWEKLLSG